MRQYLLSVAMIDGAPPRPPEEAQLAYEQVDRLNEELQTSGAWVFGGGLMPASSATVVSALTVVRSVTDGPFTESKEHIGGFWVIEATDLDGGARMGQAATRACMEPVEVRPFQEALRVDAGQRRKRARLSRSSASSVRNTAGAVSVLIRRFKDIDLAQDGCRTHMATERWRGEGPPAGEAGWIITTARRQVLDRLRREASRPDRQVGRCAPCPGRRHRRGAAVLDDRLRLMFTCCHPAWRREQAGGRADAAPGRALDLRDRPGLRRPRADHGAAHRPGQGQDP